MAGLDQSRQPELRTEKLERYKKDYNIPEYDAGIITSSKYLARLFEETVAICNKPKEVSNWIMGGNDAPLKIYGNGTGGFKIDSGESGEAHWAG